MFKNYLKTAYRNLVKTKVFSLVNILGLSIGMTACLLILYYVNYEKSYDKFHPDSERIYRLRYERTSENGSTVRFASCCPPAGARIRGNYPEVQEIGRLLRYRASVSYQDIKYLEDRMYFAEPDFLDILKFNFIEGDPLQGIREPNHAFISRSTAQKYFGDVNPIGKTISVDKKMDFEISGIFEDIPQNSHLKFDILLSYQNLISLYGQDFQDAWGHTGMFTYLLLKPGSDPRELERKFASLVAAECPWLKDYKMTIELKMQRLTDIHLTSHFMQEYEVNGDLDSVNFLLIIAVFIMVMAWVNYINLSTAHSLTRGKEVGLRKVVGASRSQLMIQFFLETIIINLLAIIIAWGLLEIFLPFFRDLTGTPVTLSHWGQSWFWIALAVMLLVGIPLSGFYPVAILSSFQAVKVIKGKLGNSAKGITLRQALVVFQFVIALALMIGTLTIYRQLSFMQSRDLGFDIEQTLVVKSPRVRGEAYQAKFETFKQTLLAEANIKQICHVTEVPGRQILWDAGAIRKAGEDLSRGKNYQIVGIDYDFIDVFELKLAAGRNFSEDFPADQDALILNETAVKWMGFKDAESAIGEKVNYWEKIYTIVGVLKDYHQQYVREVVEPHIFRLMPTGRDVRGVFAIKINSANVKETIQFVQRRYDALFPGNPFDYFFLDEYYNQQYQFDRLFGKVISLFTGLAIFVTVLGIFGLSSFTTTQRIKEIGIRKILGATVPGILMLLSRDLLKWGLLANFIAWPIAYMAMNGWLQTFAYRIELGWWIFLLSGFMALIIALLTVSIQAIKAALANPVDSLRYE